jgi:hypothetical protein
MQAFGQVKPLAGRVSSGIRLQWESPAGVVPADASEVPTGMGVSITMAAHAWPNLIATTIVRTVATIASPGVNLQLSHRGGLPSFRRSLTCDRIDHLRGQRRVGSTGVPRL